MRLIATILLLSLLVPMGMQIGVWSWYGINQSYISSVLCENKDVPMMNCDGKCVLAQKLKQAEKPSQGDDAAPTVSFKLLEFISPEASASLCDRGIRGSITWADLNVAPSTFHARLFRPPAMV